MGDSQPGSLHGRTIAIPETRELDLFADMLRRRGADVLRCPLVAIHDNPDRKPVQRWLREAIKHPFDDVILYTGEGVTRLADLARKEKCLDGFIAGLRRSRKITRGPKPARALRELGLKPDLAADEPTTAGIIAVLETEDLMAHRVGVQLYGADPNTRLMRFLDDAGATAEAVAPYVYASESEDHQVAAFIESLIAGVADAVAFTSGMQVTRLFKVAAAHSREQALRDALARLHIAAVGPLVADALSEQKLEADLMPSRSFSLRPLVRGLCDGLGPA